MFDLFADLLFDVLFGCLVWICVGISVLGYFGFGCFGCCFDSCGCCLCLFFVVFRVCCLYC